MTRGVVFAPSVQRLGPIAGLELARVAARCGYATVWCPWGRGVEPNTFLGAVVREVPSIGVGSGIVPIPLQPPTVAAMAAATLQGLAPGREVWCGFGVSSPMVAASWHGGTSPTRPVEQAREYLTVLRSALRGEVTTFEGAHYSVQRFRLDPFLVGPDGPPRVALAALNPRMLEAAATGADAALMNSVPASAAGEVAESARHAGNTTTFCYVHASVAPRADGLTRARRSIYSQALVDGYARLFERSGYGSVVERVRERAGLGDRDGALAVVPDEMCDDMFCFGDAGAVADFIARYERAGFVPLLAPELVTEGERELVATLEAGAA